MTFWKNLMKNFNTFRKLHTSSYTLDGLFTYTWFMKIPEAHWWTPNSSGDKFLSANRLPSRICVTTLNMLNEPQGLSFSTHMKLDLDIGDCRLMLLMEVAENGGRYSRSQKTPPATTLWCNLSKLPLSGASCLQLWSEEQIQDDLWVPFGSSILRFLIQGRVNGKGNTFMSLISS